MLEHYTYLITILSKPILLVRNQQSSDFGKLLKKYRFEVNEFTASAKKNERETDE
jgi:hypothetical protein